MPLVKIDMIRGRSEADIRRIVDAIQGAMMSKFAVPANDRNQIITLHDEGELIFADAGLGFKRTNKVIFIQLFNLKRTAEQKRRLYAALMATLTEVDGLEDADLIVNCVSTEVEDWSLGQGEAQFLVGKL